MKIIILMLFFVQIAFAEEKSEVGDASSKRKNVIKELIEKNDGELFISTKIEGCRYIYNESSLKWRLKRLNELAKKNGLKKVYTESMVKDDVATWLMAEKQQALPGAFLANRIIAGELQPKEKSPNYYVLYALNGAVTVLHFPNDKKIPCGDVLILTQAVSTDRSGYRDIDKSIIVPLSVEPSHAITEERLEKLISEPK